MGVNCVQTALNCLETAHCQFPDSVSCELEELKVKLRLLTTFYMSGKKWGNGVFWEATLLGIEDAVHMHSLEIQVACLQLKDDDDDDQDAKSDRLYKEIHEFYVYVHQLFWREMEELYPSLLDGPLQNNSSSSQEIEVGDVIDSLLHSWPDLLLSGNFPAASRNAMWKLEDNVRFLNNLLLFATFRGVERGDMEEFFTHIEVVVLNAVYTTFESWFYYGEMDDLYNQIINRIKPVEPRFRRLYVEVLQASKLSLPSCSHPSPGIYRLLLGNFVDSLLFYLWELVSSHSCCVEAFNRRIQKLYAGLTFLRSILRGHRHNFEKLYEKMDENLVCEAATIICSLFGEEIEVEKLELQFSELEPKFDSIMAAEETRKYGLMSASYFPQTNVLGYTDSVLEKIKSVSFAKDMFQAVYDDLMLLRSYLVGENPNLRTLQSQIAALVHETEFAHDSLAVGDSTHNIAMLLDGISEEMRFVKDEAAKTEVQNTVKTHSKPPLAREIPVLHDFVVGLDDELQKVMDLLERGTKQLDIVSIVGMAGLGKTTLALRVCGHESIIYYFHARSWCCVSQVYSEKAALLQILNGHVDTFDDKLPEMDEGDLALRVYKHLKGKRYLIVLDDVWDVSAWNSLRSSFPDDANGSRILLTSRHFNVASEIKPDREAHRLRMLTDDESWELLHKRMCYKDGFPPSLLALGREIAQLCKGLPLMIRIAAGVLSDMELETWEEVAESLRKGTLSLTEQCMNTLELSYVHLPDHLKSCFLYFGAFKEDQQMSVRELLWLWIAEGFVEKTEGEVLEDAAEGYMMELIQRSLVMVAKKGTRGRVKSCILHDLLLDFCKAKCKEERFLHWLHSQELCTDAEPSVSYRLRVDSRRMEDFSEVRLFFPRLRTLFFVADYEKWYRRCCYDILFEFCQSRVLRVLDFRGVGIGCFFPKVIELLVHLRYLVLAADGRTLAIPSSIDRSLPNLETFMVKGRRARVLLPASWWNMKKLRHLSHSGSAHWELPKGNPKCCSFLESLETLSAVDITCHHEEVLRKLPNVRRLKFTLENCKNLGLDFMSKLESLSISQRYCRFSGVHFRFPQNLKKLVLSSFCLPWGEISAVDKLPNLEALKLMQNAFRGEAWEMMEGGTFPKLRFLEMESLDLERWTALEDGFPCLEKLVLDACHSLEEVPDCLACTATLQLVKVVSCESVVGSVKQVLQEQMDVGNEDFRILISESS